MKIDHRISVAALLALSGILLSLLVPGGPIENRDFSHINPTILLSFNVFLTILGIGSFVLILYVLQKNTWGWRLSILAGLSYLIVYVIDLGKVFPRSPTSMSTALLSIEVLGSVIAIPLIYLSLRSLRRVAGDPSAKPVRTLRRWQVVIFTLLGLAIVFFATWSAINSSH